MGMNNHISWQNQISCSQNGLKAAWRPPNAEFAHLFIHAGAGDAEGAGCLGDVPVVIAEGEEDGLRFAVLDDGLELPVRARRFRNGLLAEFRGRSVRVIWLPEHRLSARMSTLRSSRMLPGHR